MLRREADGVAWWLARQAADGGTPPVRNLVLTFVARGANPTAARLGRRLTGLLAAPLDRVAVPVSLQAVRLQVSEPWQEAYFDEPDRVELGLRTLEQSDAHRIHWSFAIDQPPSEAYSYSSTLIVLAKSDWKDETLWEWQVVVGVDPGSAPSLDDLGDELEAILAHLGQSKDLRWGAVLYDHWNMTKPPYEEYFGIDRGIALAEDCPRGYYWRNFLTDRHIERLGGVDQLIETCAEAGIVFQALERDGQANGALMGATEPITHMSDASVKALAALLRPVLVDAPYHWYAGPSLRVVKQSGTAFRTIPKDILDPRFEDDPPLDPAFTGTASKLVPDD